MSIVVREDLKMSKGKVAGQVAHAGVGSTYEILNGDNAIHKNYLEKWYHESNQTKIVLGVPGLSDIYSLRFQADRAGLPNYIVTDDGKTELNGKNVTCLCIGPAPNQKIDKVTKRLDKL